MNIACKLYLYVVELRNVNSVEITLSAEAKHVT